MDDIHQFLIFCRTDDVAEIPHDGRKNPRHFFKQDDVATVTGHHFLMREAVRMDALAADIAAIVRRVHLRREITGRNQISISGIEIDIICPVPHVHRMPARRTQVGFQGNKAAVR